MGIVVVEGYTARRGDGSDDTTESERVTYVVVVEGYEPRLGYASDGPAAVDEAQAGPSEAPAAAPAAAAATTPPPQAPDIDVCDACSKADAASTELAVMKCRECELLLCEKHSDGHRKANKLHTLVSLRLLRRNASKEALPL